jgi:hypothetical protein
MADDLLKQLQRDSAELDTVLGESAVAPITKSASSRRKQELGLDGGSNPFVKGVRQFVQTVPALREGAAATVLGSLPEFEGQEEAVRRRLESSEDFKELAAQQGPDIQSIAQTETVSDAYELVTGMLGANLPQFGLTLGGAAAGAAVGSVVPGVGTVAGGLIGGIATGIGLEAGESASDVIGDPEGTGTIQERARINALSGVIRGSIDVIPAARVLRRITKMGGDELAEEIAKRVPSGAIAEFFKQGAQEGLTEVVQEGINIATHQYVTERLGEFGPDDQMRLMDAALGGFLVGGTVGATLSRFGTDGERVRKRLEAHLSGEKSLQVQLEEESAGKDSLHGLDTDPNNTDKMRARLEELSQPDTREQVREAVKETTNEAVDAVKAGFRKVAGDRGVELTGAAAKQAEAFAKRTFNRVKNTTVRTLNSEEADAVRSAASDISDKIRPSFNAATATVKQWMDTATKIVRDARRGEFKPSGTVVGQDVPAVTDARQARGPVQALSNKIDRDLESLAGLNRKLKNDKLSDKQKDLIQRRAQEIVDGIKNSRTALAAMEDRVAQFEPSFVTGEIDPDMVPRIQEAIARGFPIEDISSHLKVSIADIRAVIPAEQRALIDTRNDLKELDDQTRREVKEELEIWVKDLGGDAASVEATLREFQGMDTQQMFEVLGEFADDDVALSAEAREMEAAQVMYGMSLGDIDDRPDVVLKEGGVPQIGFMRQFTKDPTKPTHLDNLADGFNFGEGLRMGRKWDEVQLIRWVEEVIAKPLANRSATELELWGEATTLDEALTNERAKRYGIAVEKKDKLNPDNTTYAWRKHAILKETRTNPEAVPEMPYLLDHRNIADARSERPGDVKGAGNHPHSLIKWGDKYYNIPRLISAARAALKTRSPTYFGGTMMTSEGKRLTRREQTRVAYQHLVSEMNSRGVSGLPALDKESVIDFASGTPITYAMIQDLDAAPALQAAAHSLRRYLVKKFLGQMSLKKQQLQDDRKHKVTEARQWFAAAKVNPDKVVLDSAGKVQNAQDFMQQATEFTKLGVQEEFRAKLKKEGVEMNETQFQRELTAFYNTAENIRSLPYELIRSQEFDNEARRIREKDKTIGRNKRLRQLNADRAKAIEDGKEDNVLAIEAQIHDELVDYSRKQLNLRDAIYEQMDVVNERSREAFAERDFPPLWEPTPQELAEVRKAAKDATKAWKNALNKLRKMINYNPEDKGKGIQGRVKTAALQAIRDIERRQLSPGDVTSLEEVLGQNNIDDIENAVEVGSQFALPMLHRNVTSMEIIRERMDNGQSTLLDLMNSKGKTIDDKLDADVRIWWDTEINSRPSLSQGVANAEVDAVYGQGQRDFDFESRIKARFQREVRQSQQGAQRYVANYIEHLLWKQLQPKVGRTYKHLNIETWQDLVKHTKKTDANLELIQRREWLNKDKELTKSHYTDVYMIHPTFFHGLDASSPLNAREAQLKKAIMPNSKFDKLAELLTQPEKVVRVDAEARWRKYLDKELAPFGPNLPFPQGETVSVIELRLKGLEDSIAAYKRDFAQPNEGKRAEPQGKDAKARKAKSGFQLKQRLISDLTLLGQVMRTDPKDNKLSDLVKVAEQFLSTGQTKGQAIMPVFQRALRNRLVEQIEADPGSGRSRHFQAPSFADVEEYVTGLREVLWIMEEATDDRFQVIQKNLKSDKRDVAFDTARQLWGELFKKAADANNTEAASKLIKLEEQVTLNGFAPPSIKRGEERSFEPYTFTIGTVFTTPANLTQQKTLKVETYGDLLEYMDYVHTRSFLNHEQMIERWSTRTREDDRKEFFAQTDLEEVADISKNAHQNRKLETALTERVLRDDEADGGLAAEAPFVAHTNYGHNWHQVMSLVQQIAGIQPDFYVADPGDPAGEFRAHDNPVNDIIRVAINMDGEWVMGVGAHEALHRVFKRFMSQENLRALSRAMRGPLVHKQILRFFKENGADRDTLKAIQEAMTPDRSNPAKPWVEERAAYAFQAFAMAKRAGLEFKLAKEPKTLFQKLMQAIKHVIRYLAATEQADTLFEHIYSGELRRQSLIGREINLRKQGQWMIPEGVVELAHSAFKNVLAHMNRAFFTPMDIAMRRTGVPALMQLADLVYRSPLYVSTSDNKPTYLNEFQRWRIKFTGEFQTRWETMTPERQSRVKTALYSRIDPSRITDPKTREDVIWFRGFFDKMHAYAGTRNAQLGKLDKYVPVVWSKEQINAHEEELRVLLRQVDPAVIARYGGINKVVTTLKTATDTWSDMQEIGFDHVEQSAKPREYWFLNDMDIGKFMQQDFELTMQNYIKQMTRHAEFSKFFGHEGVKAQALLNKAREQGARPEEIQDAARYLLAAKGHLGSNISDRLTKFYAWVMTYQHLRVLAFATFASIVEMQGMLVRSQNADVAWQGYKAGFSQLTELYTNRGRRKEIRKRIRQLKSKTTLNITEEQEFEDLIKERQQMKNEDRQFAEAMMTLDGAIVYDEMLAYNGAIGMTSSTEKINRAFFKWIGLEGWTNMTRIMATRAAAAFIKLNAERIQSGTGKHSKRFMKELNLKAEEIVIHDGELMTTTSGIQQATGLSHEESARRARDVQRAIFQFVDESVLRPNAAQRPLNASDPHWMLLFHLKQFIFSTQTQIINRVAKELITHKNGLPLALLMTYVPVMLIGDVGRSMLQYSLADEEESENNPFFKYSWTDLLLRSARRSGILGMLEPITGFGDNINRFGGTGFEVFTGPAIQQFLEFGRAMITGSPSMTSAIHNAMPANNLYRNWDIVPN